MLTSYLCIKNTATQIFISDLIYIQYIYSLEFSLRSSLCKCMFKKTLIFFNQYQIDGKRVGVQSAEKNCKLGEVNK